LDWQRRGGKRGGGFLSRRKRGKKKIGIRCRFHQERGGRKPESEKGEKKRCHSQKGGRSDLNQRGSIREGPIFDSLGGEKKKKKRPKNFLGEKNWGDQERRVGENDLSRGSYSKRGEGGEKICPLSPAGVRESGRKKKGGGGLKFYEP